MIAPHELEERIALVRSAAFPAERGPRRHARQGARVVQHLTDNLATRLRLRQSLHSRIVSKPCSFANRASIGPASVLSSRQIGTDFS